MSDRFFNTLLRIYVRATWEGIERLPKDRPFVLASNHASHADTGLIRFALGRRAGRLHALAAADYFTDKPLKSWVITTLFNTIPFNRRDRRMRDFIYCQLLLEAGRSILIYPEGTRSVTGDLGEFRAGVGVLALELDALIFPVGLRGTHAVYPPKSRLPRPGRVHLRLGDPVPLEDLRDPAVLGDMTRDPYEEAAQRIRDAVAALVTD